MTDSRTNTDGLWKERCQAVRSRLERGEADASCRDLYEQLRTRSDELPRAEGDRRLRLESELDRLWAVLEGSRETRDEIGTEKLMGRMSGPQPRTPDAKTFHP